MGVKFQKFEVSKSCTLLRRQVENQRSETWRKLPRLHGRFQMLW